MAGKIWSPEEDQFLIENYPLLGGNKIADKLFELFGVKRSLNAIHSHLRDLSLRNNTKVIHVKRKIIKDNTKNQYFKWTQEEDRILIDNYENYEIKDIAKMLTDSLGSKRSIRSIEGRAKFLRNRGLLNCYKFRPWTEIEDTIVRTYYPEGGWEVVAQKIYEETGFKRTKQSIWSRAQDLKVPVSDTYRGDMHRKDVGTISLWSDGKNQELNYYIKVKSGSGQDSWVKYQRHVTNAAERNECVIFLNRDHLDIRPDNMVCVSQSVMSKLIRNGYYSTESELTKTGIILCKLIEAMKQQEKENQNEST